MSRLIAFGCSHTEGEGVQDPSTQSWPAYLARYLGVECVNLGKGGASNKFIQHAVHTFNFQPDDIVVILWTYPVRFNIFKSPTELLCSMLPMKRSRLNSIWYENFYTDYNASFESKVIVHQVNSFLKEKYLTVYNLAIEERHTNLFELIGSNYVNIYFSSCFNDKKYPLGLNSHAGSDCNKDYAKQIYKHIYRHGQEEDK